MTHFGEKIFVCIFDVIKMFKGIFNYKKNEQFDENRN